MSGSGGSFFSFADGGIQTHNVGITTAVVPLMKLLTLTVIGVILAHPRIKILPKETLKLLSKLVFALFLPCLIFVHLGESISLGEMVEWWFVPVNVVVSTVIGCALGYIVAIVCRPPPQFFRLVVIMTGFGNTGNLPIAMIGSICHSSDQPFGPECDQNGMAYVSFAQWVSVILVYTLVYHMMEPPLAYYEIVSHDFETEEDPVNTSTPLIHEAEWPGMAEKETENCRKPFIARVFMSITGSSQTTLPDIERIMEQDSFSEGPTSPKSLMCLAEPRVVRKIRTVAEQTPVRHILQPPTIASLLAIVVGIVPSLKSFMFGRDAPVSFFTDSLEILAGAVVPFVMLILGGMLAEGPNKSQLGLRTLIGVTVARLLVLPLFGIGVLTLADRFGLILERDLMYRFVILLHYATPSAILLGAIANLRGYAVAEASAILFWQHILAVLSVSMYVLVYLKFLF